MSEKVTRLSAGVTISEIDLSQTSVAGPVGVPAGVIGTAEKGPAFVPVTVASYSQFKDIFGKSDGARFGPIAVSEWLRSAQACTFVRVLGAGDGKQRTGTGAVSRAGFTVGSNIIQDNGNVGATPETIVYPRNAAGNNHYAPKGRTYFLGCFMSESAGSTIFSSAKLQGNRPYILRDAIDMAGAVTADATYTFMVPTAAGGEANNSNQTEVFFDDGETTNPVEGNNRIGIGSDGLSDDNITLAFIDAINGTAHNNIDFASGQNGTAGVAGLHAKLGSSSTKITLQSTSLLPAAKEITISVAAGSSVKEGSFAFADGGDCAVPIIRGVLLAPSGVVLQLSGNNGPANYSKASTDDMSATAGEIMGSITGSVKLADSSFKLLLNGLKDKDAREISLSFDPTANNYISKVLNTDPDKIQVKGHLLYACYDVPPQFAAVTGSGAMQHQKTSAGRSGRKTEVFGFDSCAFILTSSLGHATAAGSIPDYESFTDRFSSAFTTNFISQAPNKNLFRFYALSDGSVPSTELKVSVQNLKPSIDPNYKYGTFDIVIRKLEDNDRSVKPLETFSGLSLDPDNSRYIARVIGDQYVKFNFDDNLEAQKLVVEGEYPVNSAYVRVKVSDDVKNRNIPKESLPVGFRGHWHLVTSGSGVLCALSDHSATPAQGNRFDASSLNKAIEPPVPMRENIYIGTGINKKIDTRLHWGVQTSIKAKPTEPNKSSVFDKSIKISRVKYFPNFKTSDQNVWVGDNEGIAVSSVLGVTDSDLFNYNKFSLENIQVRTSSFKIADSKEWLSASYVRDGSITTNVDNKTRAFRVSDLEDATNRKFAKFTNIFQGGFDGVDIFNKEKRNLTYTATKREMDFSSDQGGTLGATIASYRKAIDIIGGVDDVAMKVLAVPGQRHPSVSDYAITTVENRFDSIFVMDIEQRDITNTVITSSVQEPHIKNTVEDFKNRSIDSSFAATYFPDVTIVDPDLGSLVSVPPSVAILGGLSFNDSAGHPWLAPAGFSRGSLSSVARASVKFSKSNLDTLYDSRINPITDFPGTEIVIWGQKTLQKAASALDRINVRRLLIEIRRRVRAVANTIIFEPNREETLKKFNDLVNPIMQSIQEQSGVDRFKVVIDSSTTTQADVENNTVRGKIFIQPTRTAEFISLDFVVTNAGSNI